MVIAMTLFSLLLFSLLNWYAYLSVKDEPSDLLEKRYCIERLATMLSKATLESKKGITTFYKAQDALIFTFDNGIQDEPLLSNIVLASVHHDAANQLLCLTIWPQPKKGEMLMHPSITLPLLTNVTHIDFAFFYPPNIFTGPVAPHEIKTNQPIGDWQQEWKAEYCKLPAIVKLTINKNEPFWFDFPYPILYPAEVA